MPRSRRPLLLLLMAILGDRPGSAQDPERPLPEPQVVTGLPSRPLLEEPAIQREIGLSEKQKTNLILLEGEHQASRGAVGGAIGDEGFDFTAMLSQTEEVDRLHRAAVGKILTAAQKNRLLQVEWQREGWPALARPDLAGKLNLSPAQVAKIRDIVDLMRRDLALGGFAAPAAPPDPRAAAALKNLNPANGFLGDPALIVPGGGPLQGERSEGQIKQGQQRSDQVRQAAMQEVAGLLQPDQRVALDRLMGPPFDFKRLDPAAAGHPARPPGRAARGGAKTP